MRQYFQANLEMQGFEAVLQQNQIPAAPPCFFKKKSLKTRLRISSHFTNGVEKSNSLRKILKTIISKRICICRRIVPLNMSHTVVLETAITSTQQQFPGLSVSVQKPAYKFPGPQGA